MRKIENSEPDTNSIQDFYRKLMGNLDTSRFIELRKFRIFRYVFWPMMTWTPKVSFTKLLRDKKKGFILKSSQGTVTQLENLCTYCEATAFLYTLGFCDQMLLSLQVY